MAERDLTLQPLNVSRWCILSPRCSATDLHGTVSSLADPHRYVHMFKRDIYPPSLISLNPLPVRLGGKTITSKLSTSPLFTSCSRCNARKDAQLKASEPQKSIRSGSEAFLSISDEKYRFRSDANLSLGANMTPQDNRNIMKLSFQRFVTERIVINGSTDSVLQGSVQGMNGDCFLSAPGYGDGCAGLQLAPHSR